MSATLGTILKELEPTLEVVMFETLQDCAQESSEAWNNAGTGHAANCELSCTPQRSDGSVDISRALQVNTEFGLSREFWSHLVAKGAIPDRHAFMESCPHMSFVWGDENVAGLVYRGFLMRARENRHRPASRMDSESTAAKSPTNAEAIPTPTTGMIRPV
jgi:malate dehydrogenase (quinone)